MPVSFQSFQEPLPTLASHDRALLFDSLPLDAQSEMWARLKEQRDDLRYVEGLTTWRSAKPYKAPDRIPHPDRPEDRLVEIDAPDYLSAFGAEVLRGGRLRCPFPDHEDTHPSASYRGTVWYCHRCAQGGGIYEAASAISGIYTKGRDFLELRRWIAERLIGQVAA